MKIWVLLMIVLSMWGCAGGDGRVIHTVISQEESEEMEIIKTVTPPEGVYHGWFADCDKQGLAATLTYIDGEKGQFVSVWDSEFNNIERREILKGKGPGEVTALAGISVSGGRVILLDHYKAALELFSYDLKYDDTCSFLSHDFGLHIGGVTADYLGDSIFIGPVVMHLGVKIDGSGSQKCVIPAEAADRADVMTKNVNLFDVDDQGGVYMAVRGRKSLYEIRKYSCGLELEWVNKADDGMVDLLSSEPVTFPDGRFQMNGGYPADSIMVSSGVLYILRGSGGIRENKWVNGRLERTVKKVSALEEPFLDLFSCRDGAFIKRVRCKGLSTELHYRILLFHDHVAFYSPYQEDEKGNKKAGSNCVYLYDIPL